MKMAPDKQDYEDAARAVAIHGKIVVIENGKFGWYYAKENGLAWNPYNDSAEAFRLLCAIEKYIDADLESLINPDEIYSRHAIFWCAVGIGKQMKDKQWTGQK
ncbi:MAG: hypothetical protein KGI54_18795 [Pseudomonadota bacterium]|nr:hypothetical protein [Pseudomonadota bacterium]